MTLLRTLRMMVKGAIKAPSPKQVALAISFGIAVGLMPKGNLLALFLGIVMCAVRLNLPVALATAVLVSFVAHLGDVAFDQIGGLLLESDSCRPLWIWISERPYSAWLQFNNTVVLGAFVVATGQLYFTYRLTLPACERLLPKLTDKLKRSFLMRHWARMEWTTRIGSITQS